MKTSAFLTTALGVLLCSVAGFAQTVNAPLTITGLAPAAGVKATFERLPKADDGLGATRMSFAKTGDERRLLAFQATVEGTPVGAKAVVLRYRLDLKAGTGLAPAVLVFDKDGGSWYKVAGAPLEPGDFTEARLSVAALRQTAFSDDKSKQLEWANVSHVWLGAVVDGAAEGTLDISSARFTDEPFKPTAPVRLLADGVGKWSAGQDPAVKSTIGTPDEGPDGKACMKYEFTVPGGGHMYAIPGSAVAVGELEGYSALRFKYKARLPEGMRMLVTLAERGGAAYFAEPPGPWASEWTEMVIPLAALQWATWSPKDPDGKFDQEDLGSVQIGAHGPPKEGGPGLMMVADVELIP